MSADLGSISHVFLGGWKRLGELGENGDRS